MVVDLWTCATILEAGLYCNTSHIHVGIFGTHCCCKRFILWYPQTSTFLPHDAFVVVGNLDRLAAIMGIATVLIASATSFTAGMCHQNRRRVGVSGNVGHKDTES